MPRHKKHRNCGCTVKGGAYKPTGIPMTELEQVEVHLDELEALRLCDALGMTQLEAGEQMGISRGTVQRLLASARTKVASALSECKAIVLQNKVCGKTQQDKKGEQ